MTLLELYKKSVVFPGKIMVFIAGVYSVVKFWGYESDYYTGWEIILMNVIEASLYWLLVCVLSSTIFLTKYKIISSSFILSALSWFLFPVGFMLLVVGKAINEFITVSSRWEIIYAAIANVPFLIGLLYGFSKFTKRNYC